MTATLQELVAATSAGDTLDLKGDSYKIGIDPTRPYAWRVKRPITIVGDGAVIDVLPSNLKNRPSLLLPGTRDVRLLGDVTINHLSTRHVGDERYEGQHGIELEGAQNYECEWTVVNAAGSSHYWGKNPKTLQPCRNIALRAPSSLNSGRQHVALQGVDGFTITDADLHGSAYGHSVFAFEPNGHNDCCRNGVITGTAYAPFGMLFGSLGLGDHQPARGNLANVTFDTFGAIGQTFSVRVMHGVGNRRGPLFFTDCYSDTVANGLTMRFVGVDGIHITRHRQPAGRGVNIYEFHEYTDAWIDGIAA